MRGFYPSTSWKVSISSVWPEHDFPVLVHAIERSCRYSHHAILATITGSFILNWDIILIIALITANGFFMAAEFTRVKVPQSEIESLAPEGSRLGRITDHILKKLDSYLSACLPARYHSGRSQSRMVRRGTVGGHGGTGRTVL